MIEKSRNGGLLLKPDPCDYNPDKTLDGSFYHQDMASVGLQFQFKRSGFYLIDSEKDLIYPMSSYGVRSYNEFKKCMTIIKEMKLSPLTMQKARLIREEE
jgi:hypothetical protein